MTQVRTNGSDSIRRQWFSPALPNSPRCLRCVSFSITRKPLLSMVIHVSSKQKLNKICGKDYPQARVDIHATNTCKMRWFQSRKFQTILWIRFEFGILFSPIHCSLINGEKPKCFMELLSDPQKIPGSLETTILNMFFFCLTVTRIILLHWIYSTVNFSLTVWNHEDE